MDSYNVNISWDVCAYYDVVVEAASEEEAKAKAKDMLWNGDIQLNSPMDVEEYAAKEDIDAYEVYAY